MTRQRTCVICKKKSHLDRLDRVVIIDYEIVYDIHRLIHAYGYYICKENISCRTSSDKLLRRKKLKNKNSISAKVPD